MLNYVSVTQNILVSVYMFLKSEDKMLVVLNAHCCQVQGMHVTGGTSGIALFYLCSLQTHGHMDCIEKLKLYRHIDVLKLAVEQF